MSKKKILAIIEEEMPESYKKEMVKDYICNISSELTKIHDNRGKKNKRKQLSLKEPYRVRKSKEDKARSRMIRSL